MHWRSKHCHHTSTSSARHSGYKSDEIYGKPEGGRKMRKKRTFLSKLNVTRLKSLQVQQDLELALTEQLASPNPDGVEAKWEKFRDIVCDHSWST